MKEIVERLFAAGKKIIEEDAIVQEDQMEQDEEES